MTDSIFELKLAKRGKRAGAQKLNGEPTLSVWLQHAQVGIRWNQIDEPAMEVTPEHQPRGPKQSKAEKLAAMNLHTFVAACRDDGEKIGAIAARLSKWGARNGCSVSIPTIKSACIDLLVENGKLAVNDKGLYIKGPNA